MKNGYKFLDHPADIGIEAIGETVADAFIHSAYGLISVIVDDSTIEPHIPMHIQIDAEDKEHLLVKWLSEILYLYDGKKYLPSKIKINSIDDISLDAEIKGEYFSDSKHKTKTDVKAVTYHQILIQEEKGKCLIRVYLDI
ncbi:MAG: archease [Ignavibacteriales bacterium]|nr:archease [Ignavibacteriales bacterium]